MVISNSPWRVARLLRARSRRENVMDKRTAIERDCADLCFAVDQVLADAREQPEALVQDWIHEAADKLNALVETLKKQEAA